MKNKDMRNKGSLFFAAFICCMIFSLLGITEHTKTASAVTNQYRPKGNVTKISVKNQTLYLEGYAFDEDVDKDTSIGIHVYIYQTPSNKIYIGGYTANGYNADANYDHHCGYYHGFKGNLSVGADKIGTWTLEVYGLDVDSNGKNGIYHPIIYTGKVTFTKEPVLSVDTSYLQVASDETSPYHVSIDTKGTGEYHISSNSSWLTIATTQNKSKAKLSWTSVATKDCYLFLDENKGYTDRTGSITIVHSKDSSKEYSILVKQKGSTLIPQIVAAPSSLTADASGTLSQNYLKVDTGSTGKYHVSVNADWLKVGTKNEKSSAVKRLTSISSTYVYVFADSNTTTSKRTANIIVRHASDSTCYQTITVTQDAKVITPTKPDNDSSKEDSNKTDDKKPENDKSEDNNKSDGDKTESNKPKDDKSDSDKAESDKPKDDKSDSDKTENDKSDDSQTKKDDVIVPATISPMTLAADASGKISNHKVTISLGTAKSAAVDVSSCTWLSIGKTNVAVSVSQKLSFTSSADFYVFAEENTKNAAREGKIYVNIENESGKETKTITVTQAAGEGKLEVSTSKISANARGVTNISAVSVKTNKTGGFQADNGGNSWIKVANSNSENKASSITSFTQDGTFYVFVDENKTGAARTGTIVVTHENGTLKQEIVVTQEAMTPVLTVDADAKTVGQDGKFYSNKIAVDTKNTGGFIVKVENNDWLRLSKNNVSDFSYGMTELSFTDSGDIYLVALSNTSRERSVKVTITHENGQLEKTVTVTQAGKDNRYLYVNRETAHFDDPSEAVDEGGVTVTADEDTKWTAKSSANWIQIVQSPSLSAARYQSIEGTGIGTFYILVKENATYQAREGKITISSAGMASYDIYVYQEENEINVADLFRELTVRVSKKTFGINKSTKVILDYPDGLYPSDIKSVTFSSNKTRVAVVDKKGVIKGKRAGKAVVTVTVRLADVNISKKFKVKITVGKRKVSISKIIAN